MRASLTMTTTVLVGLLFYLAFAATGQIDGRITDRITGEPVIGASVQVVGTSLGARTDIDGHYRILRVIPGTYSLEVTHHDYNTYRLDSVVVLEGITKVANFALGRDSTDLGKTIEVRSSAEVIDKFLTESKTTITSEGIKTKPVQTVDALLETAATVKTNQTGELHIRGGRAGSRTHIPRIPVGDPLGAIETQGSLVEPWDITLPPAHGGSAIVNNEPYDAMFFENHGVNPFVDTEDDHLSTFAADVDDASFILSRSYLREGFLPDKDAVRVEEFVNHFEYAYESPEHDAFGVTIEGAPSRFGPSNAMLLRIGVKGREIADADRKPANLVFVIDISGSMATDDRLGLVQQSLRLLTNRLKPEDRVGIVVYGSVGEVRLEPTEIRHRSNILDVINKLVTTGVTNAEEGIRLGYQMAEKMFSPDRINRIILCSDGVANVGRTGPDQILAESRALSYHGYHPDYYRIRDGKL